MLTIHELLRRIRRVFPVLLILLLPLALTACSSDDNDDEPEMEMEMEMNPGEQNNGELPGSFARTSIGDVLVYGDANRSLYTFAADAVGVSNCNEACADNWPPITATEAATEGDFSTITRSDSSLQWAFKGWPLYYYVGDAAEGDINGEGLNDAWYVARPDPIAEGSTTLGTVLVGQGTISNGTDDPASRTDYNGRTLYIFANDTANTSVCNGGCADAWPPLYADKGAVASGDYSIVTRDDGSTMWAYKEQPLYFYIGDSAPGDTTGEGVDGIWFVATP